MGEGMSRARDRRKKREREAWAKRHTMRERMIAMPLVKCLHCSGSGRAVDWREFGSHGAVGLGGRYEMCRKCGGDGKVRVGMIHINVTI